MHRTIIHVFDISLIFFVNISEVFVKRGLRDFKILELEHNMTIKKIAFIILSKIIRTDTKYA